MQQKTCRKVVQTQPKDTNHKMTTFVIRVIELALQYQFSWNLDVKDFQQSSLEHF